MGQRRRLITAAAVAVAAAAAGLGLPVQYVVEGVSMAPGLVAGDAVWSGWFPAFDRLRRPRRFERWAIAATDGTALKRVVGLPGEQVEIDAGDVVIDGRAVLKGPRLLAAMGSNVPPEQPSAPPARHAEEFWAAPPREVLDETGAARTHVLVPVRDVGVAAVVRLRTLPPEGFVRLRVQVGQRVVRWRLTAVGRHALVAGRLDGHLVAAAWQPSAAGEPGRQRRSCLPSGPPERWQVVERWPPDGGDAPTAPWLAVRCGVASDAIALEQVSMWRDVCYRPGANGTLRWFVGADECFVLGDHPAASTDSRQWGPLSLARLRQRIP